MPNESLEWAIAEIRILKRELVQLRAAFLLHIDTHEKVKDPVEKKPDDTKT
jgi:hypothetical protein